MSNSQIGTSAVPKLTLDKILIVELLTQSGFEYLFSSQTWISSIDKLVLAYMMFRLVLARRELPLRSGLGIAMICWVLYLVGLAFVRHLPLTNLAQVVLSGRFMIFYCYYLVKDDASKQVLLKFFLKALLAMVAFSILLAPLELLLMPDLYSQIFDIQRDGRGFNNTFLTSYFHSRSLFASVLLAPLAILLSTDGETGVFSGSSKERLAWIAAILVLIYLSFSRKELVIALLFVGIVTYRQLNIKSKTIKIALVAMLLAIGGLIFETTFEDVNEGTLGNDDYFRYVLWDYGYQIFDTYFPFGSGPGTYGTLLSRYYVDTYIQFDVPEYIYLGFEDGRLAPIYDVYIVSIMAEGGLIGSILTGLVILLMVRWKPGPHVSGIHQRSYMLMLCVAVLILLVATPVLTNVIGYLFFGFAGMLAQRIPHNQPKITSAKAGN